MALWRLTGEFKADDNISLADANAVALAIECNVTLVVGADDDFDDFLLDIDLYQFRTNPA